MSTMISMRFDGSCTMYEHIIEMIRIVARLKTLKMTMTKVFLVHLILDSLGYKYSLFQMAKYHE